MSIKAQLRDSGQARDVDDNLGHWRRRLERQEIVLLESEISPLRHLVATTGFELEFETPHQISTQVLRIADWLGVKSGTITPGHTRLSEVSPGPFNHYQTAQAVFWSLVQSEIIDLYSAWGQSVHFNLGLIDDDGFNLLVRWLQATGEAYFPAFYDEPDGISAPYFWPYPDSDLHFQRLVHNNVGYGDYLEAKEFSLLTPKGMARHLRHGALLGTALKNYHFFASTDWCNRKHSFSLVIGRLYASFWGNPTLCW